MTSYFLPREVVISSNEQLTRTPSPPSFESLTRTPSPPSIESLTPKYSPAQLSFRDEGATIVNKSSEQDMGLDKTVEGFNAYAQKGIGTAAEKEKRELIADIERRKVAVRYELALESQLYKNPDWPEAGPVDLSDTSICAERVLPGGERQVLRWGGNWEGDGWNYDGTIDKGIPRRQRFENPDENDFALFYDYHKNANDPAGVVAENMDIGTNDNKRKADEDPDIQQAKKKEKKRAGRK